MTDLDLEMLHLENVTIVNSHQNHVARSITVKPFA